jgi:large-conductance mechanosensitive channel
MKSNNSFKSNIRHFLFDKDLLQLILAVYLGTVVQKFFDSLVHGFIMPLMIILVPNSNFDSFEDIQIKLFNVDIAIGDIIINMINLLIGFFISYMFVTYFLYKYVLGVSNN